MISNNLPRGTALPVYDRHSPAVRGTTSHDGGNHFGPVDGVWVCDYISALWLAAALHSGSINAAIARLAETGRIEAVYCDLCSHEFRQHIEAVVESFVAMQDDLQRERRAIDKAWGARDKQIILAIQHTTQLYGSIQGITGSAALPEIKTLLLEANND